MTIDFRLHTRQAITRLINVPATLSSSSSFLVVIPRGHGASKSLICARLNFNRTIHHALADYVRINIVAIDLTTLSPTTEPLSRLGSLVLLIDGGKALRGC